MSIDEDNKGYKKKAHNSREAKANLNMVKVPSSRKPTIKGKALSWDLKGESLRSRISKGNVSTMGSKVTNLRIEDCQRGINPRKLM